MSESAVRFIDPPVADDRIVAVEMHGQFTAEDMKAVAARIEAVVGRGQKALLYNDMSGYEGFDLGALAEKFKHMRTLWTGIEKYAVIGDKRWVEVYIKIADPLTPQQLRHFSSDEKEEAFAWLTAESPT